MKFLKRIISIKAVAIILVITIFSGCDFLASLNDEKSCSIDFMAMNTYISATVYASEGEKAVNSVKEEIMRLEKLFSTTENTSEISLINRYGGQSVDVSSETSEIISFALKMGDISGGSLDITVYPIVREWGFTTGEYKIPDPKTIENLLKNTDYRRVRISENKVIIPKEAMIDLGSLAKGYAGDRAVKILKERGITSAIVNLGGNVQTIGKKPNGTYWSVGVADPFSEGYFCVLSLSGEAVATSGNYERYFEKDGMRYCHILDPKTGYPSQSKIASATVIGESGALCDALSTSIFVMGRDKAERLWRNSDNFEMILVMENGDVVISEGAKERLKEEPNKEWECLVRNDG